MQETLNEKSLLNNFLKKYAYRLAQNSTRNSKMAFVPMRNFLDVSLLGGGAPPRPLVVWFSTRAHLQVADQMLGLGQGQKAGTLGNRDPIPRGEGILILLACGD